LNGTGRRPAPAWVFDRDEDGEYNIGDLFNWVHETLFGKNTPTVEKKITRNVISLYDKVYKNYDAYFEQSKTKDINIPTTTNAWSVRQSSHTQDVCKKVFDKVKEKAILSFTFVNRGVYVEEYTLEGKTHKIAIYSYKDRFELLSENITFASLQDLKTNNYIKAAYNSKYGLIFIYGTAGELLMTIQIISDTPLQTTITWLNYLGIVFATEQQRQADKDLNISIKNKPEVEELWDGKVEKGKSNLKIIYSKDTDISVVTTEIENLLYRILKNANIDREIKVTSAYRNPENQAKAMITLIKTKGLSKAKDLYNHKGDLVVGYYETIKNYEQNEIIRLLVIKMNEVGFVSAHSDWKKRGAIDFGENSNGFNSIYSHEVNSIIESAKKEPMVNPKQVLPPSNKEPALHIEIILNK